MSPPPKESCLAVRQVLNRVGDKWSVYVVGSLADGPIRFNALKRAIEGISQRMLTFTLKSLEQDGIVTRTVYPTVPARVDYELTKLGRTLLEPVSALATWAQANVGAIEASRVRYAKVQEKKKSKAAA
jgi:DNA-binding HxlR family transcriptional regulator